MGLWLLILFKMIVCKQTKKERVAIQVIFITLREDKAFAHFETDE